jgi:predicted nucleic acid-binding protein
LTQDVLVDWLILSRKLAVRGISRTAPDLLIAATARVGDLTVVTRNVRDFADTGVVVYDPWNDQTHRMDAP